MTYHQVLNDLKKKIYRKIYFFHGEEPFYIDRLVSYMEEHVLDEADKAFGLQVLYGKDINPGDLVLLARNFPMGAMQLIIVKEAQDIKDYEPVEVYVKNPTPTTILVFAYKHKKFDKRKTFYKLLNKSDEAVVFESEKLYDNQLPGWIEKWVKELGYVIDAKSSMLLAEHLGNDLSRIDNEIQKLAISLKPGDTITPELIERNVGISKDFNIFELTGAIGQKNPYKALRIVNYFEANPKENPMQMITVMLYNYFSKILLVHRNKNENDRTLAGILGVNPFFVKDYRRAAKFYPIKLLPEIIAQIYQLDLKSKGVNAAEGSPYAPLKDFVIGWCS